MIDDTSWMDALINRALSEDLGGIGDITSQAIFPEAHQAKAVIRSKEPGCLSGTNLLAPLFLKVNPAIRIQAALPDGSPLDRGTTICTLEGPIVGILMGERIALNFLQHLSGIATAAARLSKLIAHTKAHLLDTRKTTPGLRLLEKKAVADGGGANHRLGLYDMILVKDTHVTAAGGVIPALERVRRFLNGRTDIRVEVEVRNEQELHDAVSMIPDRIMLDNMDIPMLKRAVEYVTGHAPRIELEASGGINEHSIIAIAETGVDYLSCGWITHSAPALDIHLLIQQ